MEIRQLKYTIAIAETLHFGNAAKLMYVSQPALSQQIQLLEKELGVEIFIRNKGNTNKKIELTDAGTIFVIEAKRILQSIENMTETVMRIGQQQKMVKLGIYKLLIRESLINTLKIFSEKFPDIEIRIIEFGSYKEVQQALLNGLIEIGISLLPILSAEISSKQFQKNTLNILLPMQHKLAAEPFVRLSQLRNEKWIELQRRSTPILELLDNICKKNGIFRAGNIIQEVTSFEMLASFVGLGLGIAFVPSTINIDNSGAVKKKLLNEDNSLFTDFDYKQVFVYKADNQSASVKALMELW